MLLLLEAVLSVEGDYVCAQVSCALYLWIGTWRGIMAKGLDLEEQQETMAEGE